MDYTPVAAGVDAAQGLSERLTPARPGAARSRRGPAPRSRRLLLAPAVAQAPAAARPAAARFVLVYLAALVALFISSFWTVDPFTADIDHIWTSTTSERSSTSERVPHDRAAHDRDRGGGDGDRRGARVPVRVLHGARRVDAAARVPVRRRAAAALVELPRARLHLAADPRPGRRAQLDARQARPAGRRTSRYTNWAMWIVFTYIWLPFMILPVYGALERIPDSFIEASRDLGARGWRDVPPRRPAARLPGVVAGSIFTFSLTLGDYITPLARRRRRLAVHRQRRLRSRSASRTTCRSRRRSRRCRWS